MKKDIFLLQQNVSFTLLLVSGDDVSQNDLDLESFSPNKRVSTTLCGCICRAIARFCLKTFDDVRM
jgi:hypothetical protein